MFIKNKGFLKNFTCKLNPSSSFTNSIQGNVMCYNICDSLSDTHRIFFSNLAVVRSSNEPKLNSTSEDSLLKTNP